MHSKLDGYQEKILQENFDDSKARSFKFFLSSGVLHLSLIVSTLLINELVPKSETKELVQIEFQTPTTAPEVPLTPTESQVSTAPEIGPEQAATAIVKPAKIAKATRTKSAAKSATTAAKISNQETTKIFATQDQSKNESLAPVVAEAKAFDANDLDEDFDKMDSEKPQQITNLKKELEDSTSDILVKHDEALKKLKQKTDLQNKALADHAAKMKAEDLAKIQGAIAAEKASELAAEKAERDARNAAIAAENAAKARAAEQAAQKAAAARAQAAAERAQAEKLAQEIAFGNSLGVDVPVRSLQELKQFPGNPRPNFDNDDRLAQRQGEIAFLAYVEMDGRISKFKLLKSTGHRSLDAKTYAAIRQWRFFPGQDGWVEIPIKWDLKGGVQEMPTTLRRSISQK
jgi:TonB family protein